MFDNLTRIKAPYVIPVPLKNSVENSMRRHDHFSLLIIKLTPYRPYALSCDFLSQFSRTINSCLKVLDQVFRYSENEFVVLLNDEENAKVLSVCQAMNNALEKDNRLSAKSKVSFQFSHFHLGDTVNTLFARAYEQEVQVEGSLFSQVKKNRSA